MKRRTFVKDAAAAVPALAVAGVLGGKAESKSNSKAGGKTQPKREPEIEPIVLPKPEREGGKTVLAALWERKTTRGINPSPLPMQVLSNLLWAAFGVNRPGPLFMGKPGRTAGSASNSQEIDLYVVLPEGVYLYDAVPHRLNPVAAGDFRALASRVQAVSAPVNIFFVADLSRFETGKGQPDPHIGEPEVQKSYYFADTGLIAENVYLFCAAQGLAAWFHNCDKVDTTRAFKLRPEQRVLFAQSVGYPKQVFKAK